VVRTYSGVRPLYDDAAQNASAVTRDYVFEVDTDGPPLLSIFGGKITTFRKLAEHALDRLRDLLPQMGPAWTADGVVSDRWMPASPVSGCQPCARSTIESRVWPRTIPASASDQTPLASGPR